MTESLPRHLLDDLDVADLDDERLARIAWDDLAEAERGRRDAERDLGLEDVDDDRLRLRDLTDPKEENDHQRTR
jgi:hypothetical protein